MRAQLVKIGNSQGVRIPKPLIEEVGLERGIEMSVEDGAIVLRAAKRHPRDGWAEAFAALGDDPDDELMDDFVVNDFDETEWEWE